MEFRARPGAAWTSVGARLAKRRSGPPASKYSRRDHGGTQIQGLRAVIRLDGGIEGDRRLDDSLVRRRLVRVVAFG